MDMSEAGYRIAVIRGWKGMGKVGRSRMDGEHKGPGRLGGLSFNVLFP